MRYSAETRRLLRAIQAIKTQNELGRGAAYSVYLAQARKSAEIIIAKALLATPIPR